ncbi:MAG: hypothetical protein JSV86_18125 [Gemmatimonadota bacterium]|nr:MAG: hypothetical protein JSV86_18125 [Gemmatimonadota bacterium]
MNKHWVLGFATLVTLSACSRSTQLAVQAVSEGPDGEVTAQSQLIIRMMPYDRDSIFSTLSAEATEPEPQPPADLVELRDSVAAVRARWTEAESAWNEIRSELQDLSQRMQRMDRSSTEYFRAYQRFEDLESQVNRLERDQTRYFDEFTELQGAYRQRADSFNAVMQSWGDRAFDTYSEIVDSLVEMLGEELEDTTDVDGWAYFKVPRGRWWIHTRTKLVFEELYWNVAYESAGGVDSLRIDNANAEVRPIY